MKTQKMDDAHLLLLIKGILIALLLIGIKYKYSDQKLYTYKPGKLIRKLEKDYPPEKRNPPVGGIKRYV